MNYKSFNLEDWIGHISGVIEDETTLDGNEMRDLVEFLSTLEREPCEDAINRKALLNMYECLDEESRVYAGQVVRDVKALPPATPTKCIATVKFSKEDMQELVNEKMKEIIVEPRWIPVSERLPEMPFGCIVTVEEDDRNGEPQNVLYSEPVGYDGETWDRADGEPTSFEVVAWMPLPDPYKGRNGR